ncbi:uncharacterized protein [Rutidosis leptorrhynchoides]|uniref:uncharacterized protein n=1 Tax=Rutidosis leptorrhynchoides TaxID=125765 RepID=UPI003A9A518C
MDLWVVAAAAAAGYISKYCQKLSKDKGSNSLLPDMSLGDSNSKKPASPCFASGKFSQRENQGSFGSMDRRRHLDGSEVVEKASTSTLVSGNSGNYDESNLLSLSTLPPGVDYVHCGKSYCEVDYLPRKKTLLRTKHNKASYVKPRSSLESCVMAQLYNEKVRLEDYVLSSFSSPTTRPLLVTDGSRIISRANMDSFGGQTNQLHRESCLGRKGMVSGFSLPPKLGLLQLPKKPKPKSGRGKFVRLGNSADNVSGYDGSQNGAVLFCIGITIGLISSFMANRREVERFKELLKQTENLVQDLQEELEMKNSFTVKELKVDESARYDKKPESSDSISKIEAELEAELERLGLNMNSSTLDNRSTELEIDQCFVEDFAHGDLRTDLFKGEAALLNDSKQNSSNRSTTHYGNYAVSPRELSLKLHEVINSRLEERLKELETALENSEKKVKLIESERKIHRQTFSERYSFNLERESAEEVNIVEPMVMNLSGEALNAYNEAYEELLKVNDSDEEYSPVLSRTLSYGHSYGASDKEKTTTEEVFPSHLRSEDDNSTRVQELFDFGVSEEEESSGCEDEMEKELIKQIVEKAKKGSHAMLNAQRVLFSMEETKN